MRVLLLGGTTEATAMARHLSEAQIDAVFSYAGRTLHPVAQPLPTRVGGFGGVAGLMAYLQAEGITQVIDATHPFAAGMSQNAHAAYTQTQVPLIRLERPPWRAGAGDHWESVLTLEDAACALPDTPARVFLAIGKQNLGVFAGKPQHHYLLRLVDAPDGALPLHRTSVVIARGPFDMAKDLALLRTHKITHIVAKNSGGSGARAKLDAACALGLPVIMVQRPVLPKVTTVSCQEKVMAWLTHDADRGV